MSINVKIDLTIEEQTTIFAEIIVSYILKNWEEIHRQIAEEEKTTADA